jgi:hypothetical protein
MFKVSNLARQWIIANFREKVPRDEINVLFMSFDIHGIWFGVYIRNYWQIHLTGQPPQDTDLAFGPSPLGRCFASTRWFYPPPANGQPKGAQVRVLRSVWEGRREIYILQVEMNWGLIMCWLKHWDCVFDWFLTSSMSIYRKFRQCTVSNTWKTDRI